MELQNPLKKWRTDVGYTQQQCSLMMGVAAQTWRNWEWGAVSPRPSHWAKLVELTGDERIEQRWKAWRDSKQRGLIGATS